MNFHPKICWFTRFVVNCCELNLRTFCRQIHQCAKIGGSSQFACLCVYHRFKMWWWWWIWCIDAKLGLTSNDFLLISQQLLDIALVRPTHLWAMYEYLEQYSPSPFLQLYQASLFLIDTCFSIWLLIWLLKKNQRSSWKTIFAHPPEHRLLKGVFLHKEIFENKKKRQTIQATSSLPCLASETNGDSLLNFDQLIIGFEYVHTILSQRDNSWS